jgi:hypothetical protein
MKKISKKGDELSSSIKKLSLKEKRQEVLECYNKYKEEFDAVDEFNSELLKYDDYIEFIHEMINEGLNDFLLYARKLIREKKENDI